MYENEEEARKDALRMLEIYDEMGRELLAVPFVKGIKTDKEKFAGAKETYSIEALMPDGKALQSGTTHYFGDGFAKAFGIQFQNQEGKLQNPFQTSWGVSTRLLGSIIMVHGDDNGLVLPPRVAPTQVVIIPIQQKQPEVMKKAKEYYEALKAAGIRVKLDDSDRSPGWKYAEHEMKGVPLRLEVGPRDVANGVAVLAKRNDGSKNITKEADVVKETLRLLDVIHDEMYKKAFKYLLEHTTEAHSIKELGEILDRGGYAKVMWCGDRECEDKIKDLYQATARCLPFDQIPFEHKCLVCGKEAKKVVFFARAY
jgi:prolyl-tRNA synthetase